VAQVRIARSAEADLLEGYVFYDRQQAGVGDYPDFAGLGDTRGVPMGGRLTAPPKGAAPTFIVRAMRDPEWANLDRIQIIKGWLDTDGRAKERIYDIAVSGDRKIGADGRARRIMREPFAGRTGKRRADIHVWPGEPDQRTLAQLPQLGGCGVMPSRT